MKENFLLCTKNIPFTFRDVVYLQTDGIGMGFLHWGQYWLDYLWFI